MLSLGSVTPLFTELFERQKIGQHNALILWTFASFLRTSSDFIRIGYGRLGSRPVSNNGGRERTCRFLGKKQGLIRNKTKVSVTPLFWARFERQKIGQRNAHILWIFRTGQNWAA